jgi:hypothetical protein
LEGEEEEEVEEGGREANEKDEVEGEELAFGEGPPSE